MRAGRLSKRVTLQSPTGSRDSFGERSTSWSNIATVWAAVEPISSRELISAGSEHGAVTHRVIVRFSSTISALDHTWRVLYGSRILVIDSVLNTMENDRMFELLCSEGLKEE